MLYDSILLLKYMIVFEGKCSSIRDIYPVSIEWVNGDVMSEGDKCQSSVVQPANVKFRTLHAWDTRVVY